MAQNRTNIKINQKRIGVGKFLRFKDDWEGLVDFLQEEGFIPETKNCLNCAQNLTIQSSNKNKDGCIWR